MILTATTSRVSLCLLQFVSSGQPLAIMLYSPLVDTTERALSNELNEVVRRYSCADFACTFVDDLLHVFRILDLLVT